MTTKRTITDVLAERDLLPTVANILKVYRSATDAQLAEGINWYTEAHTACLALDPINPARPAGVMAALSPKTPWPRNRALADLAFADGVATGGMPANCVKATRILNGEAPLDVLGGPKVRNFYLNILNPSDPNGGVTVDVHAFNVAVGRVTTPDVDIAILNRKGAYEAFADAYHEAARIAGIGSAQMQAVTWVVWRQTEIRTSAAVRREAGIES